MKLTLNVPGNILPFFSRLSKVFVFFFLLIVSSNKLHAQREIIFNTTGYGFDRTSVNGINPDQWKTIQKFATLTWQGQDASVTAIRLHIEWHQYEPRPGEYYGDKMVAAVQAILALNPNMKIAIHFPYLRAGTRNDNGYLPDSEVAQIYDGTLIKDEIAIACPSTYSEFTTERFHAFVNNVLTSIKDYHSKILYVTMGNTPTEEFYVPNISRNGTIYPGLYGQHAENSWRQKFLPLRFPGQSQITWDNNTYEANNALLPADRNWNSELGRDFHRFAAWGLLKQLKGFQEVVKKNNSSLKVLEFVSDFGSQQGNLYHLHNSTIPLAFELTDGIYTSDGNDQYDLWRKIAPLDVMKGTNPNKITAIEFDPFDFGRTGGVPGINEGLAIEWMRRSFVHGADYIHFAMSYEDLEIHQLAHAIAVCKAEFFNNSYQPPARTTPITENIYPNVFTDSFLFNKWKDAGGSDWYYSDIAPVSVKMTDTGYWKNTWDTSSLLPCTFTIKASTSADNATPGTQIILTVNCLGKECDAAKYTWNGAGISDVPGHSISITAPDATGNYTYSVASDRNGCSIKTAQTAIAVSNVLPVTLIRFTAAKMEKSVLLNWSTSAEVNSDFFGIERSSDGKNWKTLTEVSASGETNQVVTPYSYMDISPVNGENLYRLKMVDKDKTFAYSRIVNVNSNVESFFTVFPNPASKVLNIHTDDWGKVKKIEILNNSGQTVYDSNLVPKAEIIIEHLLAGTYFVRLTHTDGKKETNKFVKGVSN